MSGYLLGWTVFTACVWVASPQVNRAVNLLFLVLVAVFGLLAIGEGPTAKPSSESARPAESSTRSSA